MVTHHKIRVGINVGEVGNQMSEEGGVSGMLVKEYINGGGVLLGRDS